MKTMTISEFLALHPYSFLEKSLSRKRVLTQDSTITPLDILKMQGDPHGRIWYALHDGFCGEVVKEKFWDIVHVEGWAAHQKVLDKYHKNGNYWTDNGKAFREAWAARDNAMRLTERHVRMLIKLIKEEEINGKVHEHSTDES